MYFKTHVWTPWLDLEFEKSKKFFANDFRWLKWDANEPDLQQMDMTSYPQQLSNYSMYKKDGISPWAY